MLSLALKVKAGQQPQCRLSTTRLCGHHDDVQRDFAISLLYSVHRTRRWTGNRSRNQSLRDGHSAACRPASIAVPERVVRRGLWTFRRLDLKRCLCRELAAGGWKARAFDPDPMMWYGHRAAASSIAQLGLGSKPRGRRRGGEQAGDRVHRRELAGEGRYYSGEQAAKSGAQVT